MKRVITLLAQALTIQAAAVAAASEDGMMAAPVMSAKAPMGKGPIAASALAGVNLRTLTEPPDFLDQLRMPEISDSELAKFKPPAASSAMMMMSPQAVDQARGQVKKSLADEIRGSGLVAPIAAISKKKYNESQLIDVFAAGVLMSFDPETMGPPTMMPGGRRLLGWWSDLWDAITGVVEDIGCSAFATGAVPGYLASYGLFHAGNKGYNKLSGQQKFFQRAGGFDTALLDKVNIKYSAWMAPGFGGAGAVTMGSEIYVKGAKANTDSLPILNMTISPAFIAQTRLLMHEMGHSKQYAARNWNIGKFGWSYLFNYCKAGFSYSKNSMEVDAETYRDNSDKIMGSPVSAHFKKWRKDALETKVGYSKTPVEYTNFKVGNTNIRSLDLVKVSAKVGESQRKEGSFCVRVLSGSALNTRTKADIPQFPWDCVNKKPTSAPTKKPTAKPTPKPTQKPTGPTNPPTFGITTGGPIPKLSPTFKPVP